MRASVARLARVTVLGAAGSVGQPLSLLLKNNPLVSHLHLYDTRGAFALAEDVSCVAAPAVVRGFGAEELEEALEGANLVLIAASDSAAKASAEEELLRTNASIVRDLVAACATSCPKAVIGVISNPVNSTVPIAAEVLKKAGVFDPRKLCGITTLDLVRARTLVARSLGKSPFDVDVPVIGGHGGATVVPLLSPLGLSEELARHVVEYLQSAGEDTVTQTGTSLSAAYACAEWTSSFIRALRGDKGIVEYCYVESAVVPGCPYFSSAVELGTDGVYAVPPLPQLSKHEAKLMEACVIKLKEQQAAGLARLAE